MLSFKEGNKEVVFSIYAVSDIHNYPITTTYMVRAEGDIEYEFLDMVEYKHFDHVYWETVYNFVMSLDEPTNITIASPTLLNFEKYSGGVYWGKNIPRRKVMWKRLTDQIKRMGHGFKYVHDTTIQLDMTLRINEFKRPRMERIRAMKYTSPLEIEKRKEGEYLFSFDPSEESHIEGEYLFSFDPSQ